ncbi:hypothetical protein F5141DRAFT_1208501 [Pisolithus sp. B1]|nr:hypothetical protein F5141DRAFT_1208501 [Pisolithus sp. B1]
MPSHAHPSRLSSALLKSSVLKTTVSQENDDVQHAPTSISDADQDGSKQEVAQFLLEVAQAQHLVCSIEQELAKVKLRENIVLGELYKFCAKEAEWRLEIVEFELGVTTTLLQNSLLSSVDSRIPPLLRAYASLFVVSIATIVVSALAVYRIIPGTSPDGLMFW